MRSLAKLQRLCYFALCCYAATKIIQDLRPMFPFTDRRHDGAGAAIVAAGFGGKNCSRQRLLVLFTSLASRDANDSVSRAMIENWANLSPDIRPCLFYLPGQDDVVRLAESRGWTALPVPKKNRYGVPYLKEMYRATADACDGLFYGYANADIVFDSGLARTLGAVSAVLDRLDPVLVIGRRTTLDVSGRRMIAASPGDVRRLASAGYLDRADAEDYFLLTRRFPWQRFPDVVIGRKSYDNYLVARSLESNVSVIDGTRTILSLHLRRTKSLTNRTRADILFNKYKLVNKFDYTKAMTTSASYYTSSVDGKVLINMRKKDWRHDDVRRS